MNNKKYILYSMFLLVFIDTIGVGVILPILPELFMNKKYGLQLNNQYFSMEILYGFSLIVFPFFSMLGMPIIGQMADKYGKVEIILYGLIAIICVNVLCVLGILIHSFWIFIFTRALMGFLAGTYSAGMALISDISDNDKDRISNFRLPTLAGLAGLILGPSFSMLLSYETSINPLIIPFVVVFNISIINCLMFWIGFKKLQTYMANSYLLEKTIHVLQVPNMQFKLCNKMGAIYWGTKAITFIKSSLFYTFTQNNTRLLFLCFLSLQFAFGLYLQSISLFFANTFSYTPQTIGLIMVITAGAMIFSMYVLQPFISIYYEYIIQIKIALLSSALLLCVYAIYDIYRTIYGLQSDEYISVAVLLTFHLFIPFITLGFINLFANSADKDEQGKIIGGAGQVSSIAYIISGLLMGKLFILSYAALIFISSIFLILSYGLFTKFCQLRCRL